MGASVPFLTQPPADAVDELFRKNPLTNPLLEQIRIWEQNEADNIKYDGELERGEAGKLNPVYSKMLVPILEISDDLESIDRLLAKDTSREALEGVQSIIRQKRYEKIEFKKIFNAYGDNIYYSDPDRANMYLGGGATPKNEQTLAYLQRNEILTNVEDLQAEIAFLLKNREESPEDAVNLAKNACQAMRLYLEVVPPSELKEARELLKHQASG
ncbi:hypothetical protein FisN_13Lh045 [Fistulifera solaris]|uniref:Uncharacterized protein n=1 Tax=Fistulifera solaris TaxID=1519565 RepID=A0A1Z5JFQ1_FISSO|nr:hypothetical protein FisN_13Lh045 [Fistulifera solaris]|eukprot:GAX12588.1 hypothetical protein FisN_13Lh045 [Fistulifera solaris]